MTKRMKLSNRFIGDRYFHIDDCHNYNILINFFYIVYDLSLANFNLIKDLVKI